MANKRLTDLDTITTLSNDDLLYIVDPILNQSKKITFENLVGTTTGTISTNVNTLSTAFNLLSGFGGVENGQGGLYSFAIPNIINLSAAFGTSPVGFREGHTYVDGDVFPVTTALTFLSADALGKITNLENNKADGNTNTTFLSTEFDKLSANVDFLSSSDGRNATGFASLSTQVHNLSTVVVTNAGLAFTTSNATSSDATFRNIGVNTADGNNLRYPAPSTPAAAQLTDFAALKEGIRFIPVTIGSDTFRLLLSAT